MIENPPWADRALKLNWDAVEAAGLPLPVRSSQKWKFEELGCGHYGCVMETSDPTIVFKLTSDPTEAEFIQLAKPLGWPNGIVRYYAIMPLDFTFRRRTVYAIWREAAFDVGGLQPRYGFDRQDYELRSRQDFTHNLTAFKENAARFRDQLKRSKKPDALWAEAKRLEQWAWNNVGLEDAQGAWGFRYINNQRGAYRLAASYRACAVIAETMEHTYLSDLVGGAFSFYMDNGFLLADVHAGNVGRVNREDYDPGEGPWVITDPGHVVVLD